MPPVNNNVLYAIIAALLVGFVLLSWQLYEARKEPQGLQINIGPGGASIQKK
jgi:hypothetical protein